MTQPSMSVTDALKTRISIRAFLDKPVEESLVREVLETARWSPSGGNLQPWKVIAVAGAERQAVVDLARERNGSPGFESEEDEHPVYPAELDDPYRTRRRKVGADMYELLGIDKSDRAGKLAQVARNFEFFGAPVGLFFVIDRGMGHGQWAHMGMFMQSIALAATERGLGTCMQEFWGSLRKSLHSHFALPENEVLYCGMSFGWPDMSAPVNTLRSDREEVDGFATFRGF